MKLINFLNDRLRMRKKAIYSAVVAAFFLFFGTTQYTHATWGIDTVTYAVVTTLAGGIAYILAWIFGILISVESWFITIVLNINAGIFQTSYVQTGFSISLSVANLAFVLGIIVIALSTILRIESYGIKQMLWKLVLMAILVNFGLVIIAPIFALSNSFTQYFLNCITPANGGCNTTTSGLASYGTFADVMVAKFSPSKVLTAANQVPAAQNAGSAVGMFIVDGSGYSAIGAALVPIFSLVFSIIDFLLIVFVLGAFIVMLIIRYIYIAILAILLPFAWAAWVFPSFKSMYSKWWSKFLQWTFFAPIFMFFLYLAFATIGGTSTGDSMNNMAQYAQGSSWNALVGLLGGPIQNLLTNFLQEVVVGGMLIGGLIAADSMGVKFAGSAVTFAQKQGKTFGKFYGKQAARAGFRAVGGKQLVQNMRTGNVGLPKVIAKIPLIGTGADYVTRKITTAPGIRRGLSVAGRAIEPKMDNKDLVEERMKTVPDNAELTKKHLKEDSMSDIDKFAHIAKLIKNNDYDENTPLGNGTAAEWLDKQYKAGGIESAGFGKYYRDHDKAILSDVDMRTEAENIKKLKAGTPEMKAAIERLADATNKFLGGLQKSDVAKAASNVTLGNDTPISRAIAKGFLTVAPHLASSALPKMKGPALRNFKTIYEGSYNEEVLKTNLDSSLNQAEKDARTKDLDDRLKTFTQSMANNSLFSAYDSPSGTPSPAPTPTP